MEDNRKKDNSHNPPNNNKKNQKVINKKLKALTEAHILTLLE